jgi:hypothetical protein
MGMLFAPPAIPEPNTKIPMEERRIGFRPKICARAPDLSISRAESGTTIQLSIFFIVWAPGGGGRGGRYTGRPVGESYQGSMAVEESAYALPIQVKLPELNWLDIEGNAVETAV